MRNDREKLAEFDELSSAMAFEDKIAERRKERPDYATNLDLIFLHSWWRNGAQWGYSAGAESRQGEVETLKNEKDYFLQESKQFQGANLEFRSLLAVAESSLKIAREALEEFADFKNPYEPKDVAWPASVYMHRSREALRKIKGEE